MLNRRADYSKTENGHNMVNIESMLELKRARKSEDWWDNDTSGLIYDAVASGARMTGREPAHTRFKVETEGFDGEATDAAVNAAFEDYDAAFLVANPNYEVESVVN